MEIGEKEIGEKETLRSSKNQKLAIVVGHREYRWEVSMSDRFAWKDAKHTFTHKQGDMQVELMNVPVYECERVCA